MSDSTNAQKTPVGLSLNRFARTKALDQIAQTGRSLPCTVVSVMGSIVQVAFQVTAAQGQAVATIPNVTIPIIGSEYIRLPIQPGCPGMTVASDAYLGGVSGQGGGVAVLARPPNLAALAFVPLGNVNFSAQNGNVLVMYGPQGVTLADATFASTLSLTPNSITLNAGGKTLVVNSSGVTIDGILWETHQHTGVQSGGSNTGGPVA
jgi:GpV Apex motif